MKTFFHVFPHRIALNILSTIGVYCFRDFFFFIFNIISILFRINLLRVERARPHTKNFSLNEIFCFGRLSWAFNHECSSDFQQHALFALLLVFLGLIQENKCTSVWKLFQTFDFKRASKKKTSRDQLRVLLHMNNTVTLSPKSKERLTSHGLCLPPVALFGTAAIVECTLQKQHYFRLSSITKIVNSFDDWKKEIRAQGMIINVFFHQQ